MYFLSYRYSLNTYCFREQ